MQTLEIKILTKTGIVTVIYDHAEPLGTFEQKLIDKYGDFVQLEVNEITAKN